jgi:hypothetical protein
VTAIADAYELGHAPTAEELDTITDGWRPFRSWVSFLLGARADALHCQRERREPANPHLISASAVGSGFDAPGFRVLTPQGVENAFPRRSLTPAMKGRSGIAWQLCGDLLKTLTGTTRLDAPLMAARVNAEHRGTTSLSTSAHTERAYWHGRPSWKEGPCLSTGWSFGRSPRW